MKKQNEILTTMFKRPSGLPPNTLGIVKQNLQDVISADSFNSVLHYLAIGGLLALLVVGIVYIIKSH
jgi:hypothetical protein